MRNSAELLPEITANKTQQGLIASVWNIQASKHRKNTICHNYCKQEVQSWMAHQIKCWMSHNQGDTTCLCTVIGVTTVSTTSITEGTTSFTVTCGFGDHIGVSAACTTHRYLAFHQWNTYHWFRTSDLVHYTLMARQRNLRFIAMAMRMLIDNMCTIHP